MNIYIFDACALIAYFLDEIGSDKIEDLLELSEKGEAVIYINIINVFEIYYNIYKVAGLEKAKDILQIIKEMPIILLTDINNQLFIEAGRLKVNYKISLADSFAIAESILNNAFLVTSDHHEFDIIEKKENLKIFWIRSLFPHMINPGQLF